ncbi:MAG TPA: acylglycerol kinase family protein, partial [Flavitalea sp.]|nr:acylglycerol kinase family protein [Flavitalea sp.]
MLNNKHKLMELAHIYFIINPSAGGQEPILEIIGRVFHDSGRRVTIHVLEEGEQADEIARGAASEADLIAVYGGDGSVTLAASALIGTDKPLAIIPG